MDIVIDAPVPASARAHPEGRLGFESLRAIRVVAIHPVAQGLTVHAIKDRCLPVRTAIINQSQKTADQPSSVHLPKNALSASLLSQQRLDDLLITTDRGIIMHVVGLF